MQKVIDSNGLSWSISREWLPRRKSLDVLGRFKENKKAKSDILRSFEWLQILGEEFALIALFLIGAIVFFLFPVFIIIIDLSFLLLLLLFGTIAKTLFRRPWNVIAKCESGQILKKEVVGWTASKKELELMVAHIRNFQ